MIGTAYGRKRWMVFVFALVLLLSLAGCRRRRPGANSGNADPRDDAFAAYVNEAARAILAMARGQPYDPRWDPPAMGVASRTPSPIGMAQLSMLGPQLEILGTLVEVEAVAPSIARIRTNALVFPDGRVRWVTITARTGPTFSSPVDLGTLMAQAPALVGAFGRMTEGVRGACNLPLATPADLAFFPPEAQAEAIRAAALVPSACATVRALAGVAWLPRFDDITVIVRGNAQVLRLRSEFELTGGRLVLDNVRVLAGSRSDPTPMPVPPPIPSLPPAALPLSIALAPPATTFRWSDGDWVVRVMVTVTNTSPAPTVITRTQFTANAGAIRMTPWMPVATFPPMATLAPGQSASGYLGWYYSGQNPQPSSVTINSGAFSQILPVVLGANPTP